MTLAFSTALYTRLDMGKSIGEKVKRAREARDISQQQLAQLIETSQVLICLIEQGKRKPGIRTAAKLSKVLEIEFEEFLED